MTSLELFALLRTIVMQVTGVPECINSDQAAPAPAGQYAAISVAMGAEQYGQGIVERNPAPGQTVETRVRTQNTAKCSVNFYRGEAMQVAEKLKNANRLPSISAMLFAEDVFWKMTGPVNNLTALQANRQEQRAQIDVFLMYETVITDSINTIESATVEVVDFDTETGE